MRCERTVIVVGVVVGPCVVTAVGRRDSAAWWGR